MMAETSLQARFLIPMAVTIVFGLGVVTFLVLFLIPALVVIGDDIGRLFRRRPNNKAEFSGNQSEAKA